MFFESPPIRPTVLLRHDLPDGSWHIDWMLATDESGQSPLVTFRLDRLPTEAGTDLPAMRLADHRPRYLAYEGPLSRGRGAVIRLKSGSLHRWLARSDGVWEVVVEWETSVYRVLMHPDKATETGLESRWHMQVLTHEADPVAQ